MSRALAESQQSPISINSGCVFGDFECTMKIETLRLNGNDGNMNFNQYFLKPSGVEGLPKEHEA